jgi:hypothetical protein
MRFDQLAGETAWRKTGGASLVMALAAGGLIKRALRVYHELRFAPAGSPG